MKRTSRRTFLKNLALGGIAIGGMPLMSCIKKVEEKQNLPVIDEVDICVLGGSCTGVFAAVRAARLGAKVAVVEKQNCFGGVATNSLVNVWHSLLDATFKEKIIGGMTDEVVARLRKRGAVTSYDNNESIGFLLNTQELKIDLDEIVMEAGVKPYLHTLFSEPYKENDKLTGVIVDSKSGRGIIKAKYFIDATGDGDLCVRLGVGDYRYDILQPPTVCAHFDGVDKKKLESLIPQHAEEFGIPNGFVWGENLPGTNTLMVAGTRIYGRDCSDIHDLTMAEIEGRRQVRAIMDIMSKYGNAHMGLNCLPSYIGVRETRHIKCLYQVSDDDALYGKRFDDAVANGSYRLDIHHQDKPGVTFRYLDGRQVYIQTGAVTEEGRWTQETLKGPLFYQIPLRSLIPQNTENVILAGRMLDAGIGAFSGIRVMVNLNQVGEAAGVTAYLACKKRCNIGDVAASEVRSVLQKGGSVII